MESRSGEMVSPQVAIFGDADISKGNFSIKDGQKFLVKNEGTESVELEVIPAGSKENKFVKCTFDVGWNPEIVREIKMTSLSNVKIKFGY